MQKDTARKIGRAGSQLLRRVLLMLLGAFALGALAAPAAHAAPRIDGLRIVNLTASYKSPYLLEYSFSLRDRTGHAVRNIPLADFQIDCRENGLPISLTETGAHMAKGDSKQLKVMLVLDYTKSMNDAPGAIDAMEKAAMAFVDSLNADALVGVYEFHRHDLDPVRVTAFTNNKTAVKEHIAAIRAEIVKGVHLGSRVWDATYAAVQEFGDTNPFGEQRFVVVLSDGHDESSLVGTADIIAASDPAAGDVKVFPIALGPNPDRVALQDLANRTGGTYYEATSLLTMRDQFNQIVYDLGGQYILRWQTLKRAATLFTPSFTIGLDGYEVDSPVLGAYDPSLAEVQGDILRGALRLTKPESLESASILRAEYVPPFINRFRLYVQSDVKFHVELESSTNNGLCSDWSMILTNVPETGGVSIDLQGKSDLGFARFGSILRFVSDDRSTTMGFNNVWIDNAIYASNAGQAFDLAEAETWYANFEPSSDLVQLSEFGVKQDWQLGRNPRVLADVDGDGRKDIVGFSDAGVVVSRSMLSSLMPETSYVSLLASYNLSANPNWKAEGEWQYGVPKGQGGRSFGNPDPVAGKTGASVYGVNLAGDYATLSGGPYYLTAGPIDCSGFQNIQMQYYRWLNTDQNMYTPCTIEVSNDGVAWSVVWTNGSQEITDSEWTKCTYSLSPAADLQKQVWIRWGYTVKANAYIYSGWNIDDITLSGETDTPRNFAFPSIWSNDFGYNQGWSADRNPRLLADVNGDGRDDVVGFGDKGVVVATSTGDSFNTPGLWVADYGTNAGWNNTDHIRTLADVNGDGRAEIVTFGGKGVIVSTLNAKMNGFNAPLQWSKYFGRYDDRNKELPVEYFDQPDASNGRRVWKTEYHPRLLADVDGDGRADIVGFHERAVFVSLSTGSGFADPIVWVKGFGINRRLDRSGVLVDEWKINRHVRLFADVGGAVNVATGKPMMDLVAFGDKGVQVALSKGTSFEVPALWVAEFGNNGSAGGWDAARHIRTIAERGGTLNAKTNRPMGDILAIGKSPVVESYSTGSGFSAPTLWNLHLGEKDGWNERQHLRLTGDVNGDGIDEVVAFGYLGVQIY